MRVLRSCKFFRLDYEVQRIMEVWWNNKNILRSKLSIFPKYTELDLIAYLKENFNVEVSQTSSLDTLVSLCSSLTLAAIATGNKVLNS